MISEFSLMSRRADETPAQFREALMTHHAGKVYGAASGYILNFVTDASQKAIVYQRGLLEVDALSQRLSPTPEPAKQEAEPSLRARLTTFQHVILPPPAMGSSVKRMSFLARRSDVTAQTFEDEWFDLHARLVKRLPGLLGYRQNLVIGRQGDPAAEAIEGVVELWFADTTAIETAFRTQAGTTLMSHAKEFIGAITTFMVDPVELVPEPCQ